LNPTTPVVSLLLLIWTRPHLWPTSFFHFEPDHTCGFLLFSEMTRTTGFVDFYSSGAPRPRAIFACQNFNFDQQIQVFIKKIFLMTS
jgi:hypothetical protein